MKRQITIDGEVAFVPLTKGFVALIDASDVHLVQGFDWSVARAGRTYYARRKRRVNGRQITVRLHAAIVGETNGLEVDHENGNGLDCRRANLRLATHAQNIRNRGIQSNNKCGLKGVQKHGSRYKAKIQYEGIVRHLGVYQSAEEAHAAYCAASFRYHGEFGRTA